MGYSFKGFCSGTRKRGEAGAPKLAHPEKQLELFWDIVILTSYAVFYDKERKA